MKGQDVPPERPPCPKAVVLIRERYEPSPHEIRRDQRVDLMNARTLAVVLSLSLAAPALADDGHRELGAHVHGHGTLNIAVETTRVELELEAPGMDIVGFEHEAKTAEHKAAIEAAKAKLKDPLSLFKVPDAAACKVADAKIEIEAGKGEHDHKDAHGHDDDGHKHDHGEDGSHTAFHVTYAMDCAHPASITSIVFDYFKAFAGSQELDVTVVTAKGQNKYEISREKPTLELAEGL